MLVEFSYPTMETRYYYISALFYYTRHDLSYSLLQLFGGRVYVEALANELLDERLNGSKQIISAVLSEHSAHLVKVTG